MQASSSYQQHHLPHHLPPSPPPSPPTTRRRTNQKKTSRDPFLDLGEPGTPLFHSTLPHSTPSSPHGSEPTEPKEPLLVRFILTPIYFTSFLLSLFLIDSSNRRQRTRRTTNPPSILSYFTPSTWLDPEPYQDPTDSTWGNRRDSAAHVSPPHALSPSQGGKDDVAAGRARMKRTGDGHWYLHKKIRKVARLEIGDAFEMRGRVIFAMVVVWLGLVGVGWWTLKSAWAWVWA